MKRLLQNSVNYLPAGFRPLVRRIPGLASLQRKLIDRFIANAPFVHVINAGPASGLRFEVTLPLDRAADATKAYKK
jgi:hypothetical protein